MGGILSRKLNENEIEQLLDSEGNFFERRQILELIAGRPWANNNGYGFTSDEQLDLAYLLDENLSELYRCDLRIIQAIALRNKIEETKNSNKLLYDKLDHVLEHAVHYCRNTISEVREKNINPPENTTTNFGLIISPLHWAGFGDEEFGYDSNFRALENPELEKSLIELMLKEAKNLPEGPKKENVLNQLKNRKEKI